MARTFDDGGILLAEAPTGIGKSLAYLVPAVLTALERDRRVVIATCTKSLQDQLMDRDLPAVLEALGVSVPCARLKGKQNYLCPRALESALGSGAEEEAGRTELVESTSVGRYSGLTAALLLAGGASIVSGAAAL